jgi:chromate transport protein ChrA
MIIGGALAGLAGVGVGILALIIAVIIYAIIGAICGAVGALIKGDAPAVEV